MGSDDDEAALDTRAAAIQREPGTDLIEQIRYGQRGRRTEDSGQSRRPTRFSLDASPSCNIYVPKLI